MTPSETLILATYFFVLVILAVYGWHRYYLVYLYMKNKGRMPVPAGDARRAARGHDSAPDLQRDVRRRSADRRRLPDRLSARAPRDPGPGRLDRRNAQRGRAGRAPQCRARRGHHLHPSHGSHRLQGRRARGGPQGRQGRVRRDLRRRLHSDAPISSRVPCRSSPIRRWRWSRRAGDISTRTTRCSRRSSRSCSTATSCSSTAAATAPDCSSTSTARPASGVARRLPMRAAGSTTRSPRISTSAIARSCAAGASSSCRI